MSEEMGELIPLNVWITPGQAAEILDQMDRYVKDHPDCSRQVEENKLQFLQFWT
jgi:hypothetical protein